MSSKRGGFTLIELMVVVIIIAALAGMVLPRVIPASDEAKKNIAKGDLANISTALKLYRLYNSVYPPTGELAKLMDPAGPGPYLEKKPIDLFDKSHTAYYDYKFIGDESVPPFMLTSRGPDGQLGTQDDVKLDE